ncbi:MAG: ABC transporter permease [Candidatus Spyradocola sp.]
MEAVKTEETLRQTGRRLSREQRALKRRKFLKNRLAVLGGMLTLTMLLIALLAPVLSPYGPYDMVVADRLQAPSAAHPFGTDSYGRDVLTRVLYGARVSMSIGAAVAAGAMVLGMAVGLLASYFKVLDNVLMRICDGLSAVPSSLLAIALMAALGGSVRNVIVSLVAVSFPGVARIARASAMVVKEQTYIEAMRASGARTGRILLGHIAPNILSPVIVQVSFVFASAIITEAALSFLGVGVPVPEPSWGNILNEGKEVIYKAWWMILFPGLFTALSVLGLNILGDGLRDFLDPHSN